MTALAQVGAGVALVMAFALLRTGQVRAAAIILAVQALAVALTATILYQPLMAIPPLLTAAGFSLLRQATQIFQAHTNPVGGAKLGIGAGAALAVLCQSLGAPALPAAILLLAILLAATRSHPLMQVAALVAATNALALAASLLGHAAPVPASLLLPLTCLLLPLPLAAGLLIPAIEPFADAQTISLPRWLPTIPQTAPGLIDLGVAICILVATLIVPLDSFASVFAPLLAIDGLLRSWVRRTRPALNPIRRAAALMQTAFTVLAVCAPHPVVAWLAVLATMTTITFPTISRCWSATVLAFLAAALALFGLLLISTAPSIAAWFCLFAGFATIAATVPELAAVLVILILRLADQTPWPPGVEALGTAIATLALLACAALLTGRHRTHRTTLLVLSHASIATLVICAGQAEGRFAALILLILLILSKAAARITTGPIAGLAIAGLGGVPPLGVFPALVLVVLALSGHAPWLLLPLGLALIPIVMASIPRTFPTFTPATKLASIAWLPLLMAVAAGYFAPNSVVQWWRILTAGRT